jgi:hypothetical protein
MSHGNLDHQLVPATFWPSCETCAFFTACQTTPRHPAYPHRWHWAYEAAHFPDALLILLGEADRCPAPSTASRPLTPSGTWPWSEAAVEVVFTQLDGTRWTTREQATFTATLRRYKAVLTAQAGSEQRPSPELLPSPSTTNDPSQHGPDRGVILSETTDAARISRGNETNSHHAFSRAQCGGDVSWSHAWRNPRDDR